MGEQRPAPCTSRKLVGLAEGTHGVELRSRRRARARPPASPEHARWSELPSHIQQQLEIIRPQTQLSAADWFDGLTTKQRVTLLVLRAKLSAEGLLPVVSKLVWVGEEGQVLFAAAHDRETMARVLADQGYGDWWGASSETGWGMRSRWRGAQLHFRGYKDGSMNVHLDLRNPGDPKNGPATSGFAELGEALQHEYVDVRHWHETHTPDALLMAMHVNGISLWRQ